MRIKNIYSFKGLEIKLRELEGAKNAKMRNIVKIAKLTKNGGNYFYIKLVSKDSVWRVDQPYV